MSSAGQIDLKVGSNGVAAPAQHVANASALRASLIGFYLAYWEHVMQERGGLRLLLLDDPQELLDEENRERLAGSLHDLLGAHAQLIVTTHDRRFAAHVAALARLNVSVDHRSIHPATGHRPTMQVPVSVSQIVEHESRFKADRDDVKVAQDYASECRTFIEARLGDMFDDTAYPAWSVTNSTPTLASHLGRLHSLVNAPPSDLFRSQVFRDICNDPGLADHAPVRRILNQAHHNKQDIRPVDVAAVADDLVRIRKSVECAHEECRRWRRRDRPEARSANVASLRPLSALPTFSVLIHPDLAAFTSGSGQGGTQDVAAELIGGAWLTDKALFYVRSDNLGYQMPRGSIAVVDAEPYAGEDRDLVVARYGDSIGTRRLLRTKLSSVLTLATETPDPQRGPPTLLLPEEAVSLHRIVGAIFDDRVMPPRARGEAVQIDDAPVLDRVEAAFRVRGNSAIPLALPNQVVLGGPAIDLLGISAHRGRLLAVCLDDGSEVFKRIGDALPPPLAHVWQFESIGGLGESRLFAVGAPQAGYRRVVGARQVIAVVYGWAG